MYRYSRSVVVSRVEQHKLKSYQFQFVWRMRWHWFRRLNPRVQSRVMVKGQTLALVEEHGSNPHTQVAWRILSKNYSFEFSYPKWLQFNNPTRSRPHAPIDPTFRARGASHFLLPACFSFVFFKDWSPLPPNLPKFLPKSSPNLSQIRFLRHTNVLRDAITRRGPAGRDAQPGALIGRQGLTTIP